MSTDSQLSDALTAYAVAQRTLVEAILNRVTHLVTTEQLERLRLTDRVDVLEALAAALLAAVEEREAGA